MPTPMLKAPSKPDLIKETHIYKAKHKPDEAFQNTSDTHQRCNNVALGYATVIHTTGKYNTDEPEVIEIHCHDDA
jgi:hypothetical protein